MTGLPPTFTAPADVRQLVRDLDDTHCQLARVDPNAFNTYVLRDAQTNQQILQSPIHQQWHDLLDRNRRSLIWAHAEAGKSTQISIGRVLFELGQNPNIRIGLISGTAGLASRTTDTIAKYITDSAALHRVFPKLRRDKDAQWNTSKLFVERTTTGPDASFTSIGVHGSIIGARLDLIILDDILSYENTLSQHRRDDLHAWYNSTVETRLTAGARVWCIGTAWHRDDLMHRLARSRAWTARRFPVMTDKGMPTWPEQWPAWRIREKREAIGPLEFSRAYMTVARSDEDARFKQAWIDQCVRRGEGKTLMQSLTAIPAGFKVYTGVDLAHKSRAKRGDSNCLFTIAVHPNGDRQVLDVQAGRWAADETLARIINTHMRYHSHFIVEDVGAQQHIIDILKGHTAIPVSPYTTTRKVKVHPEFGLEAMAVEMSNSKWIIPSSNGLLSGCHPEVRTWLSEALYYDPRSHAGDRLMASWFAREGAGKVQPKIQVAKVDLLRR